MTEQEIEEKTNKYIIDVIEKYLPVGTNYIIVDENMNVLLPGKKSY